MLKEGRVAFEVVPIGFSVAILVPADETGTPLQGPFQMDTLPKKRDYFPNLAPPWQPCMTKS